MLFSRDAVGYSQQLELYFRNSREVRECILNRQFILGVVLILVPDLTL